MKNIHVLSTEKPRKYRGGKVSTFTAVYSMMPTEFIPNMYITNDEEIKEGDWCHTIGTSLFNEQIGKVTKQVIADNSKYGVVFKKIILTTDQDLIKDGVQAIDDEFLEWFVENPSCERVEVESKVTKDGVWTDLKGYVELPTTHSVIHKIIIPKEEPKQEHSKYLSCCKSLEECHCGKNKETLEEAKLNEKEFYEYMAKQDKNKYSEEEVYKLLCSMPNFFNMTISQQIKARYEWFEQIKKK